MKIYNSFGRRYQLSDGSLIVPVDRYLTGYFIWCDHKAGPAFAPTIPRAFQFIHKWREAYEDGRTDGNFILASEETLRELNERIIACRTNAQVIKGSLQRLAELARSLQ